MDRARCSTARAADEPHAFDRRAGEPARRAYLPIGVVGVAWLGATLSLGWAGRLNNRSLGLIFRIVSSTVHRLLVGG